MNDDHHLKNYTKEDKDGHNKVTTRWNTEK